MSATTFRRYRKVIIPIGIQSHIRLLAYLFSLALFRHHFTTSMKNVITQKHGEYSVMKYRNEINGQSRIGLASEMQFYETLLQTILLPS